MPRFFLKASNISGSRCVIDGNDFIHLSRVRRVKPGEEIDLRAPDGAALAAKILEIGDHSLTLEIIDKKAEESISLNLTLCAALLKGKKFDMVVQKAAETGVARIIPVASERTIPDIEDKEPRKLERWNRIASEAAKQCLRGSIPAVEHVRSFSGLIKEDLPGLKLLAHPGRESRGLKGFLKETVKTADMALLVGPEGGFSPGEIGLARGGGWIDVNFGLPQLRAETASMVLPAILMYEWGYGDENNSQQ